jgi:hypothetical protein
MLLASNRCFIVPLPRLPGGALPDPIPPRENVGAAASLRCTLVENGTKRHLAAVQQTVAFGVIVLQNSVDFRLG